MDNNLFSLSNPRAAELFYGELRGDEYGDFLGLFKKKQSKQQPVLRRGDSGDDVKDLQTLLGLRADGSFGSGTEKALKDYQASVGLNATGIADQMTWAYLLGEKKPKSSSSSGSALQPSGKSSANKANDIAATITGITTGFTEALVPFLEKPLPDGAVVSELVVEDEGWSTTTWALVIGGTVVAVGGLGTLLYLLASQRKD